MLLLEMLDSGSSRFFFFLFAGYFNADVAFYASDLFFIRRHFECIKNWLREATKQIAKTERERERERAPLRLYIG